jgi:hypothetical protein
MAPWGICEKSAALKVLPERVCCVALCPRALQTIFENVIDVVAGLLYDNFYCLCKLVWQDAECT